jgi:hypothetical protein
MEKLINLETLEKYPLTDARKCIENYVDNGLKNNVPNDKIVRAFTVKAQDVIDTLGMSVDQDGNIICKYDFFRAYIGQEPAVEKLNLAEMFKLFLVPVVEDEKGSRDIIPADPDGRQYVYDFNTPCPNSCDYRSPLFYAGILTDLSTK